MNVCMHLASREKDPPGAMDSRNPKSMCMMCPSESMSRLPLWRSLIRRMYENREYAAKLAAKFFFAASKAFSE